MCISETNKAMNSTQSSIFQSFRSSISSSALLGDNSKKQDFWEKTLSFRTTVGRYLLLIFLLTASFVPALILLVQNIRHVYDAVDYLNDNLAVNNYVEKALEIKSLVYHLQVERGQTALYVGSSGDNRTRDGMLHQRMKTDYVFYGLTKWSDDGGYLHFMAPNKTDMMMALLKFRHDVDSRQLDDYDVVTFFSQTIESLIKWMKVILNSVTLGKFSADLTAFQEMTISAENTGQERARGAIIFTRGYVNLENQHFYIANVVIGRKALAEASNFSALVLKRVMEDKFRAKALTLDKFREMVYNNHTWTKDNVETAKQWVNYITTYINALHEVQNELGVMIMEQTQNSSARQRMATVQSIVLMILEFFVYPTFVILAVRLTKSIKQYSLKLSSRMKVLAKEQRRNAALLKEMYPPTVAQRLLKGDSVEPESFESATVCFSGVADFDDLSRISHGVDIIFFVNRLFELMDDEVIKYDVYKVETVGDQYVIVSGLPIKNGESHVAEVADMALAILEMTSKLTVDHLPNCEIRMRFGICTGSVVAGIVGLKMPRYCLFGDTVNVASRMHTSCKALRIQMSSSSGKMLIRNGNYHVRSRGKIDIKGKGKVETFWLLGKSTR